MDGKWWYPKKIYVKNWYYSNLKIGNTLEWNLTLNVLGVEGDILQTGSLEGIQRGERRDNG